MIQVRLPWPERQLSPNFKRSHHWASHYKYTKAARQHAFLAALSAKFIAHEEGGRIPIKVVLSAPGKCRMDRDNREGSCKAYLDGIADALKVDDNLFDVSWAHIAMTDFVGVVIMAGRA